MSAQAMKMMIREGVSYLFKGVTRDERGVKFNREHMEVAI